MKLPKILSTLFLLVFIKKSSQEYDTCTTFTYEKQW